MGPFTTILATGAHGAGEVGSTWVDGVHQVMHVVAVLIGILGVLVLVWGVVLAGVLLVRTELCRFRGDDPRLQQVKLQHALGSYLRLSLEFLIAADIIETIINPDLDSLIVLGVIVVIRTVISVTLGWELKHAEQDVLEGEPER